MAKSSVKDQLGIFMFVTSFDAKNVANSRRDEQASCHQITRSSGKRNHSIPRDFLRLRRCSRQRSRDQRLIIERNGQPLLCGWIYVESLSTDDLDQRV